ncbi:AAA family ATPase [Sinorhizobium medicae]|uniref:AAA family ATPase n=1 Tax=Sinorhizobium medicae TaxID=110321 RepID=UPI000FD9B134|nr:AAA family ATPase [Sinorhizobium medicae]RVJ35937.1 AAA family ATPase [Sinorhizobium medicae]
MLDEIERYQPPDDVEPLPFTTFASIKRGVAKKWIIQGFAAPGETYLLSGPPKSNKSTIELDAAIHAAFGRDWFGKRVRKPVLVVYIAAERASTTYDRILAFKKHHGIAADEEAPLVVIDWSPVMTDTGDRDRVIATIRQAEAHFEVRCGWIIVDTLTQTFGSGDQNSNVDMGNYAKACVDFRKEVDPEAALSIIHHAGHGAQGRPKGAVDLLGVVDASYIVKVLGDPAERRRELHCHAGNSVEAGKLFDFSFKAVCIAEDVDEETGEVIPAFEIVAIPADASRNFVTEAKAKANPLIETFKRVLIENATESGGSADDGYWWHSPVIATETAFLELAEAKNKGRNWRRDIIKKLMESGSMHLHEQSNTYRLKLSEIPHSHSQM